MEKNFLHKSPSIKWFRNGNHSLQSRADGRGIADIIIIIIIIRNLYSAIMPLGGYRGLLYFMHIATL